MEGGDPLERVRTRRQGHSSGAKVRHGRLGFALGSAGVGQRRAGKSGLARLRATTTFAAIVAESEPNDNVPTANRVELGDRATGVVNPAGDADTWFVDLTAGQFLSVDVDAAEAGSSLDATLEVADRQNALRPWLTGYALTMTP